MSKVGSPSFLCFVSAREMECLPRHTQMKTYSLVLSSLLDKAVGRWIRYTESLKH